MSSVSFSANRASTALALAAALSYSRTKEFRIAILNSTPQLANFAGAKISQLNCLRPPRNVFPFSSPRMTASFASSKFQGQVEESPVVSCEWLDAHLEQVKILDASWYMPAEKRHPLAEFERCHIPGSLFFDINAISDVTSNLPHMLPHENAFSLAASSLGLKSKTEKRGKESMREEKEEEEDPIVIYDGNGLFSAARAWWMFRAFGHERVWVLEGGLPRWKGLGLPLQTLTSESALRRIAAAKESVKRFYESESGETELPLGGEITYHAKLRPELVKCFDQVLANVKNPSFQVVDARSKGRYDGSDPEPRKEIPSGHIPNSLSVPFPKVLTPEKTLRPKHEIIEVFNAAGLSLSSQEGIAETSAPSLDIIVSCGTGVTACILSLALQKVNPSLSVSVYDGSWTEWGSRKDSIIEKTVHS